MELHRQTTTAGDITLPLTVLTYTYEGDTTREVIIRVDLGGAVNAIAGGGEYKLNVFINDTLIVPETPTVVPGGKTKAVLISRTIALDPDDVLRVEALGRGADDEVDVVASVRDVTPITIGQVRGSGTVPVDHNFGGTDNLAYRTSSGSGVLNATVIAYVKSEYDAGNRGADYRQGFTHTVEGGRWAAAIGLIPGTYTIVFEKPGAYGPDAANITVT